MVTASLQPFTDTYCQTPFVRQCSLVDYMGCTVDFICCNYLIFLNLNYSMMWTWLVGILIGLVEMTDCWRNQKICIFWRICVLVYKVAHRNSKYNNPSINLLASYKILCVLASKTLHHKIITSKLSCLKVSGWCFSVLHFFQQSEYLQDWMVCKTASIHVPVCEIHILQQPNGGGGCIIVKQFQF